MVLLFYSFVSLKPKPSFDKNKRNERYITALPQRVQRSIVQASALEALEGHSETSSQNDVNRDLIGDEDDQRSESAKSRDGIIKGAWGRHADVDLVPSKEDNRQELQSLLVRSDTGDRNESKSGKSMAKGAAASDPSEKSVAAGGKEPQRMSMTYLQELENALGQKKVGIMSRH